MKTANQQWQDYFTKCYPQKITDIQYDETKTAFFAGMLSLITSDMDMAVNCSDEFLDELTEYLMNRANKLREGV